MTEKKEFTSKKKEFFNRMAETNNSRIIQVNTPESSIIADLAIQSDIALRNVKNRIGFTLKASEGEELLENFKDAIRSLHTAIEKMNTVTHTKSKEVRRLNQWLYPDEAKEAVNE